MQTIQVICVGKCSAAYFSTAAAEYEKRLGGYCKIQVTELTEETIHEKSASEAVIAKALEKEADAIMSTVKRGAAVVAMCIEGKQLSSEELSLFLADKAQSGAGDVAFIIGSSHGLAPCVKQQAACRLSMSKMTFPHGLARVMLLEQIYRAFTITAGAKYHK